MQIWVLLIFLSTPQCVHCLLGHEHPFWRLLPHSAEEWLIFFKTEQSPWPGRTETHVPGCFLFSTSLLPTMLSLFSASLPVHIDSVGIWGDIWVTDVLLNLDSSLPWLFSWMQKVHQLPAFPPLLINTRSPQRLPVCEDLTVCQVFQSC